MPVTFNPNFLSKRGALVDLANIDCIGYRRVSTVMQAGETLVSIPDQTARGERLAAELGNHHVGHWFHDEWSGSDDERPGFLSLVTSCLTFPKPPDRPGIIVCLDASRWFRADAARHAELFTGLVNTAYWDIFYVEGDLRGGDSDMRYLNSAFQNIRASGYRRDVKKNVRKGHTGATAKGFWQASAPYGYRRRVFTKVSHVEGVLIDPALLTDEAHWGRILKHKERRAPNERIKLWPHDDERRLVHQIFDRYAGGTESLMSLAEWCLEFVPWPEDLLVEPLVRDRPRKKQQWVWDASRLRYLLTNPVYLGHTLDGRRPYDRQARLTLKGGKRPAKDTLFVRDTHLPIIEPALADACATRLAENQSKGRSVRSTYLLSGLVRCTCGLTLTSGGSGQSRPGQSYYRCHSWVLPRIRRCSFAAYVRRAELESHVVNAIADRLTHPAAAQRIVEAVALARATLSTGVEDALAALDKETADLKAERQRVFTSYQKGWASEEVTEPQMKRIDARLAEIETQRVARAAGNQTAEMLARESEHVLQAMASFRTVVAKARAEGKVAEVRELIAPWIVEATVNGKQHELRLGIAHLPMPYRNLMSVVCRTPRDSTTESSNRNELSSDYRTLDGSTRHPEQHYDLATLLGEKTVQIIRLATAERVDNLGDPRAAALRGWDMRRAKKAAEVAELERLRVLAAEWNDPVAPVKLTDDALADIRAATHKSDN